MTIKCCVVALVTVLSIFLGGCAIDKQGNNYSATLDRDGLFATTTQEFKIGTIVGGVRKLPNGQFEIKLYDRSRVIPISNNPQTSISATTEIGGSELIAVFQPTQYCPYAHRIYQVRNYDVYWWDVNNIQGQCGFPLNFTVDAQSWNIKQVTDGDKQTWIWAANRLSRKFEPVITAIGGRPQSGPAHTNSPATSYKATPSDSAGSKPESAGSGAKVNPFEGATFVSSTPASSSPSGKAPASVSKSSATSTDGYADPESAQLSQPTTKASKATLAKIQDGNYSKPGSKDDGEMTAIHVNLK